MSIDKSTLRNVMFYKAHLCEALQCISRVAEEITSRAVHEVLGDLVACVFRRYLVHTVTVVVVFIGHGVLFARGVITKAACFVMNIAL